jgi:hydroxypyruvate isomerase
LNRRKFMSVSAGATAAAGLCVKNLISRPPAPGARVGSGRSASPESKGLRLSTTWWLVNVLPVGEALALLIRLGYDAFEMFDWRKADQLKVFGNELKKHPLTCATLVANKGVTAPSCGLVNPAEREEFLNQLNLAIDAAKLVGCKRLVVLTGNELGGMPRSEQMTNAVQALREAAPLLEKNGMMAVVEVLNTYVNHAGYFLYYVRDGAEMVDRVGSPNVKLLFDIYHVQIMEGNLISQIRSNIDRIGHFHIGDVPGRHEPGTGEINYRNVFKAIYDLGDRYQGYAALEYSPLAPLEENLRAMRELTTFK